MLLPSILVQVTETGKKYNIHFYHKSSLTLEAWAMEGGLTGYPLPPKKVTL